MVQEITEKDWLINGGASRHGTKISRRPNKKWNERYALYQYHLEITGSSLSVDEMLLTLSTFKTDRKGRLS